MAVGMMIMIVPDARCRVLGAVLGCKVPSALMLVHGELGRRNTRTENARGADVKPRNGEAAQRALQLLERQTGVEHRAQRHVSRNSRETVEIQHATHS